MRKDPWLSEGVVLRLPEDEDDKDGDKDHEKGWGYIHIPRLDP